jgi:hypothetical protein
VFSGDPPARSEATEGGVEHPLPRSEEGGKLGERRSLDRLVRLLVAKVGLRGVSGQTFGGEE